MKWIDLTKFGCELYIHSDTASSRNPETGLPDFRIKVIDNALYEKSLLKGSVTLAESPDYEKTDQTNLYRRTSKTNLSPIEFSSLFGKENITQDMIIEKTLDDVVFQGHILDLKKYNIDFNTVNFEGEKRPSLLVELKSDTYNFVTTSRLTSVFREVSKQSDLSVNVANILEESPHPGVQNWHGSYLNDEDGNRLGAYIYFNNVNDNTIQILSSELEKAAVNQMNDYGQPLVPMDYKHFNPDKRISDKSLESLVTKVEGVLDPSSTFKSTRKPLNVINEAFDVLLDKDEVKSLKPKSDSLKVYALRENSLSQGTVNTLKESNTDAYEELTLLAGSSSNNVNSGKMNYRPWYLSPSFLNTDELRIAFDNKDSLIEYFGLDNEDEIIEVDQSDEANRLVCINEQGLMLFTSTNNPIERARHSAFNEGNSFKMKIIFDEFKSQREELSQMVNIALTTLDETSHEIELAYSNSIDKVVHLMNLKGLLSGDLDYLEEENQVQDFEITNMNNYEMRNLIGQSMINDISTIKKWRDTYVANLEKQKLEDERKAKEAYLEQQRKEALIAVNDFIETDKAETSSKERIEDYGEKIGGAVKDNYRFLSKNLSTLSQAEYAELLSGVDHADLTRLAKKTVVLGSFDPITLEAEGVDPETAYAIKLLTLAIPTSAEKAGVPPAHYIHAAKKMHDIMYRNRGLHLNDFREAVKAELNKDYFLNEVTGDKTYYSLRKMDSEIFTSMLEFESTEEALKAVEKEKAEKNIYSKYSMDEIKYQFDGKDSMTEKERAIANLTYLTYDFTKHFKIACTACLGKVVENLYIRPYGFSEKIRNATCYVNKWYKMITPAMLKRQAEAELKESGEAKNDGDLPTEDEEAALDKLKAAIKENQIDSKEIKHLGHVVREGEDYQVDDINEKVFAGYFGFRAVEFGEWLPQKERKVVLKHAFDAFMDLTSALQLPTEEASLGGELAMAFGSRGRSSALAHFEPQRNVINLTRMKGAGSLAHEFGHALDKRIVNYLCEKYPGFKLLTKGGGFISESFVENANSKKYKPSIDSDVIRDMRNVIKDEADKKLLDDYIDLHKAFLLRKNSEELRIERSAEKVMKVASYAPRAITNMISSTYIGAYQAFESVYGEPEATNHQREYRKSYGDLIRTKEFDRYIQVVSSEEVFDLHSLNDKLLGVFTEAEKVLHDKPSTEFHSITASSYMPSLEEIEEILVNHMDKGVKELVGLVSQFTPAPENFEIPEVEKEIVFPYSFSYLGEKIEYDIKIEDPWLKYLYSESKDFGGSSSRLYQGAFEYLWSTSTGRVEGYMQRLGLRKAVVVHGRDLESLEQTHTNPDHQEYRYVETQYFQNATALDKNKYYYREPVELFARAFESYVLDELEQKGQRNDYLVSSGKAPGKQDKRSSRYPLDYERKVINEKIDNLMISYSQAMNLDSQTEKELER